MAHHAPQTSQNTQFVFDGKTKLFTLGLAAIGAICLLVTWLTDSEYHYARFWTSLLHNGVFFTGISFAALFFICTHTMAWGGWFVIFKRIPEAMMMYMPVGAIALLLVGAGIAMDAEGTDLLYMWADEEKLKTDKLVIHKSQLLNPMSFFLTIVVVAMWFGFAYIMRKISIKQDSDKDAKAAEQSLYRSRFWAAIFLPIAGFSSAYVIWLWVMSVDTHWYSTLFAWYASVSLWVSAISVMLLIAVFLKSRGHLEAFTKEHMHDLGKYIFGFSVFWTYLWFSQFMLIWYSNNGEETQYFFLRFEQFKPIFFLNILINFLVPFFTLMMNSSKRTLGTVGFVAGVVCFGHWLDFYQMIKPGVWYNYEHGSHAGHDHSGGHGDHGHTSKLEKNTHGDGKAMLTYYVAPDPDTTKNDHGGHGHDSTHVDSTHAHTDSTHADTTHNHDGHDHADHDGHDHADHDHDGHDHGAAGGHGHDDGHGGHGHGEHKFVMGFHFPSLLDLGTMLGFLGLFLFVTFTFLSKASLYPKNDPFLGESEHHHT